MKRILIATTVFLLLTGVSISAAAQTRPGTAAPAPARPAAPQPAPAASAQAPNANAQVPNTKMALVDTSIFTDEKTGITRLLNAIKAVQREFQPRQAELDNLQTRIKTISDEITKLSGNAVVGAQTIQAKREEGERLQRDLKYKKEQADADFAKRYNEVVGPISTDIGKGLDAYAAQHGITMILDITKLLPAVLTASPAMDVTRSFISEYNSKNP